MKTFSQSAIAAPALIGAMALSLMAASPADAQSRHRDRDRDNDRTEDVLIGAAIGALACALIGDGDGSYIAGGALAGAALGASSNNGGDCDYYRGGRCYRNQGHWEREHGINSRDRYDRYDRRDDRRDRRDYRRDRRDDRRLECIARQYRGCGAAGDELGQPGFVGESARRPAHHAFAAEIGAEIARFGTWQQQRRGQHR